MFWIVLVVFVIVSALLTVVVLMQEPKQSGLGDALGGGGGAEFGTLGGTAGGLHRITIYLACIWAALAILLQVIPR
jgi:preprotein translocase subunit SecG